VILFLGIASSVLWYRPQKALQWWLEARILCSKEWFEGKIRFITGLGQRSPHMSSRKRRGKPGKHSTLRINLHPQVERGLMLCQCITLTSNLKR
jgi:hypothetical protein